MKYYIKFFYKSGVKPLLINIKQCGVGHLFEVVDVKESDEADVMAKINEALASRELCINEMKFDSKYNKLSGNIRLASKGVNTL